MARLMISHGGALGDNGFIVPALNALREIYDEIYMCGLSQAFTALGETGLVDKFIVKPSEYGSWDQEEQKRWLIQVTEDIDIDAKISFNGVIPGRYMFHADDPRFDLPLEWKRSNASNVSFFDAMSERAIDSINGISQFSSTGLNPLGKRPITRLTTEEQRWLLNFRNRHNIPNSAFILGWQFTGSSRIKWYPFFNEVIQKGIMSKYSEVYVVGLGDLDNKIKWDFKHHGGRFINLGKTVSFRQAYILTSIFDCLVSPETGLMVFAQAFEHVPKILLATHSYGYHFSFQETTIIQSKAGCSPCYKIVYDCKHDGENPWTECMGKIAPEWVIEAIERVINLNVTKKK
jgi:hypothetical protein